MTFCLVIQDHKIQSFVCICELVKYLVRFRDGRHEQRLETSQHGVEECKCRFGCGAYEDVGYAWSEQDLARFLYILHVLFRRNRQKELGPRNFTTYLF